MTLHEQYLVALGDPTDGGLHPTELPYEVWLEQRLTDDVQRIRELEADPDRPTVVYAGDELEAAEERITQFEQRIVKYDKVAEAARTQAHEHPDESWGYDGAGIHQYDGDEPDDTDYARWAAKCPLCAALTALDSSKEKP